MKEKDLMPLIEKLSKNIPFEIKVTETIAFIINEKFGYTDDDEPFRDTAKKIVGYLEGLIGEIKRTEPQTIKFSCSDWEGDTAVSSATVCKKCGREKWEH